MNGLFLSGFALTILSWICAWNSWGLVSDYSFFPLWLGYILTINGLAEALIKRSLLSRMKGSFVWLFVLSMPMWWFFERINKIVQNWHYKLYPISDLHYFIQASVDFSTVIPAVLSTAFLAYALFEPHCSGDVRTTAFSNKTLTMIFVVGLISFVLVKLFPNESFPLVWIAPVLVLEPIAYKAGTPCMISQLQKGKALAIVSTMAATFICGICWELWNYYSFPKWYYTIPYVGFWKIFEMPILGYLGYPFFGLVILAYTAPLLFALFRTDVFILLNKSDF